MSEMKCVGCTKCKFWRTVSVDIRGKCDKAPGAQCCTPGGGEGFHCAEFRQCHDAETGETQVMKLLEDDKK